MQLDGLRSWEHPSLILRHTLRSFIWVVQGKNSRLAREIRLNISTHDLMEERKLLKNRFIPNIHVLIAEVESVNPWLSIRLSETVLLRTHASLEGFVLPCF